MTIEVTNPISKESTKGAFLIRNSWRRMGESGFGWLPYKYFEDMYAEDVWVLLKTEWIDEIPFIQGE